MTFQMFLTLNGTSPRVAMELMRHSDMKLTMKTCTDAGKLLTRSAIEKLPSLLQAGTTEKWTPQWTPKLVKNGHSVSQAVTPEAPKIETCNQPQTLINRG
jgi:hypothetical protein